MLSHGEEGGEKDEADIDMDINFQRRIMHNNAEKVPKSLGLNNLIFRTRKQSGRENKQRKKIEKLREKEDNEAKC